VPAILKVSSAPVLMLATPRKGLARRDFSSRAHKHYAPVKHTEPLTSRRLRFFKIGQILIRKVALALCVMQAAFFDAFARHTRNLSCTSHLSKYFLSRASLYNHKQTALVLSVTCELKNTKAQFAWFTECSIASTSTKSEAMKTKHIIRRLLYTVETLSLFAVE
jgi:hypothetical protein